MIFKFVFIFLLFSVSAFSQDNYIRHTISKGDNLYNIAKKYGVKPKDIANANPDAPKILKLNSVLLIPNSNPSQEIKSNQDFAQTNPGSHEVLAKETLWGISKKYKVSVENLKKANPLLESEGLKIGQQIVIPSNGYSVVQQPIGNAPSELVEVSREVLPKETKYAIAKEFGITVTELEKQNPEIKNKLPIGYQLKILASKEKAASLQSSKANQETSNTVNPSVLAADDTSVKKDSSTVIRVSNHPELVDQLIINATENIGTRYRSGGTTKAGFDCSGLMYSTFGNFDIRLPRSSIEQSRIGTKVNPEEAQKGDLIFFKTNGRRQINHVGMVIEVVDEEIKFVHSSTHGGVIISSTKEPYYERSFSQVNRVLE
ncbi:LysM peptidoglycan-binding domain-containing protein [Flavobacterium sp. RS13.1]|uniref:C40 family peptidase n=1 Tax=Flavobacterium sp. RS13.1 TaxID=3400345 RepID=UPI003AAF3486